MRAITIDRYRMYVSADGTSDENSVVLYNIPGFKDRHNELKVILKGIDDKLTAAQIIIPLVGPGKSKLKSDITGEVCEYMSYAEGWATNNNNTELIAKIHYPPSALRSTADAVFISRCRTIIDTIEGVAEQLAGFGLTPEMLAALKEKINTYEKMLSASRMNVGNKKVANINLETETAAADAVLVKMDKLVDTIQRKNPDVYTKYKTARVIVNAATRKTKKKDEEEGEETK